MIEAELLNYIIHILIIFFIFTFFSLSATISIGLTGLFNLSFPGLALFSAYCSALLAIHGPLPFEICLFASSVASAIIGYFLSAISNRFKGDYYALVTFGFNYVVLTVCLNWESLTNGALGITNIPFESLLISPMTPLKILTVYGCLCIFSIWFSLKLKRSPLGRCLMAIRDDEVAMISIGRNVFLLKNLSAFVSGFFSGSVGALYAHYISYIDPFSVGLHDLVFVLASVFLGGLGSLKGAVAGTFILTSIPELLRFLEIPPSVLGPLRQMIYAVILVIIIWLKPKGIFGRVVV
ncbi:MAG: branched-chain amino acid ABC transporter permease [Deltaproteobacteria bacterium]|nr:branched-chain amino acid ABC transporter permease [Deltaproteobacteria bacterium]MCX7953315.1 branched-chain amino acid ABC transporter permease [Deltaproteobacteria bacterium]